MSNHDVILKTTGLSKRYRIGSKANADLSIKQQMVKLLTQPVQRFKDIRNLSNFDDTASPENVIWALKDVSFEVRRGEMLGIMGANGAGKSTLLKILSRIITPTSGEFWYQGSISSLLEVGTGFNGELTGRENVYLNGSILGMRRAEIDRVFDEIVDFSGVEKFIDTPVKRYSSGMTVRLAFSVAAHLDPDILVLDEVLSVGDAQFSQKSMQKMESIAKDGRTVILVSHSTSAVSRLCDRAIFLAGGAITASGSVEQITGLYLGNTIHTRAVKIWDDAVAPSAEGLVKLISVKIVNSQRETLEIADIRQTLGVEICFQVLQFGKLILPEFQIINDKQEVLFTSIENRTDWVQTPREAGLYTSTGWIEGNFLQEGRYGVNIALSTPSPRAYFLSEKETLYFQVIDPMEGDSARSDFGAKVPGFVSPRLSWSDAGMSGNK
jgi:lipopolysaccharide transport system ATP-binding protein